ncbi:MAG TPA: gamma-glutamylcyclotransferase family protein [Longimicrobiales bacterium]|nr:gamma-glutamylcyclotransferase family protein [Longimicrobiales bacterium]
MSVFQLFVYGTLRTRERAASLLQGCECTGIGRVHGTLYDIDGAFPALMLYGETPVTGEIWRCPAAVLPRLDEYEGVGEGLFRRVATAVTDAADPARELACWTYVAGPALARKLTPDRRTAAWSG